MNHDTPIPKKGEDFTFAITTKPYILWQNRPWECRSRCTCGDCDGASTPITLPIEQVIYWADNSIEVTAVHEGKTLRSLLRPPSGDACF